MGSMHRRDLIAADDFDQLLAPAQGKMAPYIHFVWVGSPPPPEVVQRIDTWAEVCPDFEVVLWHETALLSLLDRGTTLESDVGRRLWESSLNPAAASDVARFVILHEFGGIYLDTDMDANRSLTALLDLDNGFVVRESRWLLVASALGLPRGSSFARNALELMEGERAEHGHLDNYMSGPPLITELVRAYRRTPSDAPAVLDPWTFFPDNPFRFPRKTRSREQPYGIHLFAHTWSTGGELSIARRLVRLTQPLTPKDIAVGNRRATQLRLRRRARDMVQPR